MLRAEFNRRITPHLLSRRFLFQPRDTKTSSKFGLHVDQIAFAMPQQNQQMIDEVAYLANEMFASLVPRFASRFHNFSRLFDYLGPDLCDTAGQKLARI